MQMIDPKVLLLKLRSRRWGFDPKLRKVEL
jgi:hypothetical protein